MLPPIERHRHGLVRDGSARARVAPSLRLACQLAQVGTQFLKPHRVVPHAHKRPQDLAQRPLSLQQTAVEVKATGQALAAHERVIPLAASMRACFITPNSLTTTLLRAWAHSEAVWASRRPVFFIIVGTLVVNISEAIASPLAR